MEHLTSSWNIPHAHETSYKFTGLIISFWNFPAIPETFSKLNNFSKFPELPRNMWNYSKVHGISKNLRTFPKYLRNSSEAHGISQGSQSFQNFIQTLNSSQNFRKVHGTSHLFTNLLQKFIEFSRGLPNIPKYSCNFPRSS